MSKSVYVGDHATRKNCKIRSKVASADADAGLSYALTDKYTGLSCDVQPITGSSSPLFGQVKIEDSTHYASTDTMVVVSNGDVFVDDAGQVYEITYWEDMTSVVAPQGYIALMLKVLHE